MRIARRSSVINAAVLALIVGGGVALAGHQVWAWGSGLGAVPAALILWLGLRRALRRWRLTTSPFPERWRQWLDGHVPLYGQLDDAARERFERDVCFVMDEYSFEGVKGVEVTQTLRLSVAAGAATLLHGRPSWELPGSRSVLFYPGRFNDTYYDSADAAYDGMAHEQGPIILTAPAVEASWADPHDADNVVLHELAHLFDFDNEGADGVPSFVAAGSESSWQALVRGEMRRVQQGRSVLRPYAAEAPSEFFAVAVETFFEQPHRLARHHDDLFRALVAFFHLDPRTGRRTATVEGEGTPRPEADQVTGPADDTVASR
jgi:hypothetical protein